MAAPIQSKQAAWLLSLPSEILQMIFQQAYRGISVKCKCDLSPHIVVPAYLPSILVSKTYAAEAKQAVLQEATFTIRPQTGGFCFTDSGIPNPDSSSEFSLIRHLRIPLSRCPDKEELGIIVRAAPKLRALTLTYEHPIVLYHTVVNENVESPSKVTEGSRMSIKREAEKIVCSQRGFDFDAWAILVEQWSEREEALEVFMETEVMKRRISWRFAYREYLPAHHLSTVSFSTRTWVLTAMPGKDNYLQDKNTPEFTVSLDLPKIPKRLIDMFMH
ncbi:uncharacterized protein AB675_7281 [Cyphellophora attinorum]|uniref:Uncharacterized protein n=1 Tax=Cyphellophora attinorum TaxID=1664694 RepID=A0A0N1GZ96_9EURO|nr:uncharacterized protein AB675_7281 [Phialophora attinorum]KPI36297.1 hypothetical protein AB675_7281 [Phialophora attinorum]